MSQITVAWRASAKLREQEYIETGERPDARRKFAIDLEGLTQKERKPLIEYLGLHCFTLGLETAHVFSERWPSTYLEPRSLAFDCQPSLSTMLDYVASETAAQVRARAYKAGIEAKKKVERERMRAIYDELRPGIEELVRSGDLDAMEKFCFVEKTIANFKPGVHQKSLSELLQAGIKAARKVKRADDKTDWIAAHGSGYLKRAHAMGYDAQRLYVTERAEMEAPGFMVDFDKGAEWKDRTCPTPQALDAEAEAEALGVSEEAMVVWLRKPAVNSVDYEDGWYDEFEPCEAVVIRNYLGQLYDLVREL